MSLKLLIKIYMTVKKFYKAIEFSVQFSRCTVEAGGMLFAFSTFKENILSLKRMLRLSLADF